MTVEKETLKPCTSFCKNSDTSNEFCRACSDPRAKALYAAKKLRQAAMGYVKLFRNQAAWDLYKEIEVALTYGWQTIDSAPRDGRPCQYAVKVCQDNKCWWEVYNLYLDDGVDLYDMGHEQFDRWSYSDFTHWREITPPTTNEGEG